MQTPYEQLGDKGVRDLVDAFYNAMDERIEARDIRAMHADNLDAIKDKLYDSLSGWFGGPQRYQEKYGTVCLTGPHKPYAIGAAERDQWLDCMNVALERIEASDVLKAQLEKPFFNIADALRNAD